MPATVSTLTEAAWWALLVKEPEDEGLWQAFSWWLRDEADDPAGAAWVDWYRRPGVYVGDGGSGSEIHVRHRAPRGPAPDGAYWLIRVLTWSDYNPNDGVLSAVAAHMPCESGRPWEPGTTRDFASREAAERAHLAGWRAAWAAGWRPEAV